MTQEELINKIDTIASDFLLLSREELDIPTAGKLLNQLDAIGEIAGKLAWKPILSIKAAISDILEKLIIDAISDKETSFNLLEKGLSLLQETAQSLSTTGSYPEEELSIFVADVQKLTGYEEKRDEAKEEIKEKKSTPSPMTSIPSIQDEGLVRDFINEGLEYIEEIEVNILNLEQNPKDTEIINSIFRPFHSIKGVAGFLNLSEIRDLAHSLENLLDKARNGVLPVTPAVIDVILDGADTLKTMIKDLSATLEGKPITHEPLDIESLMENIASLEEMQVKPKKIGEILLETGAIDEETLEEALEITREQPGKKVGEALIEKGVATPKQVAQALRQQTEQMAEASTIRVDTRKLDDLIDMVGELVIAHSIIRQDIAHQLSSDRNLMRDIAQLTRITASLQQTSTSLRMVPIKQTFQRMSRLVRDLARNKGKNIRVEMVGEETEIDRHMVDEIYNPLVHMVRNSVDHGIETPEEREAVGKPPRGTIELKAYHRGGNIVIEISDDGRGLDRQKILEKAIRLGRVHAGEDLSDDEIYRLIFLPGFSTAEKVTDVSGRGVGMDVVKKAVEKLRGKIDIKSTPGKGVTFITSFPLTMAIIDGMIVRVGGQRYILPTTAIRQALRPSEEQYTNVVGKGEMINVMGNLMPLLRLSDVFGIQTEKKMPWEAITIVVEAEGRMKCLLVDEILGKTEVVIKSLGEALKKVRGIAGGAILGDGQIGLILDVEGLFYLAESQL
ncbi:MAG: chemotaxis protein CheA [Syntrophales bacterium]|nr:chemotaxis protein CheA [Syntrophales bacterium]